MGGRALVTASAVAVVATTLLVAALRDRSDGATSTQRPCTLTSRLAGEGVASGNAAQMITLGVRLADPEAAQHLATATVKRGVRGIALCRGTVVIRDAVTGRVDRRVPMTLGHSKRTLTARFHDTSPIHLFGVEVRARRTT